MIFLDDLQWADSATLNLLEPLLAGAEIDSLLLIGAYRDNEVDAAHPLTRALAELEAAGIAIRRMPAGSAGVARSCQSGPRHAALRPRGRRAVGPPRLPEDQG